MRFRRVGAQGVMYFQTFSGVCWWCLSCEVPRLSCNVSPGVSVSRGVVGPLGPLVLWCPAFEIQDKDLELVTKVVGD